HCAPSMWRTCCVHLHMVSPAGQGEALPCLSHKGVSLHHGIDTKKQTSLYRYQFLRWALRLARERQGLRDLPGPPECSRQRGGDHRAKLCTELDGPLCLRQAWGSARRRPRSTYDERSGREGIQQEGQRKSGCTSLYPTSWPGLCPIRPVLQGTTG